MMAKRHSQLIRVVVQRGISLLLFSILFSITATAQIWSENFNSYPDATTQGPPKWSTNATDCDDGGNLNLGPGTSQWGVWSGQFAINDIEGAPCCPAFGGGGNDNTWLSEVINIANYCNVSISMDVSASGVFECDSGGAPIFGCQGSTPPDNSHDQIVAEYRLNAGAWTQFGYVCGMPLSSMLNVTGLNGNTVQIRFSAANKSNNEYYYIDNIVVDGTTAPTPTFNPVGPLCENAAPVVLPTTSNQGITGTWNPSSINPAGQGGNTITATFTPTAGQCAVPTTMMVSITSATNPMPSPIGPFCTNSAPENLPTNVSGINGNWSGPGVGSNIFNPMSAGPGNFNLTFTPSAGQCANTASLPVTVTQAVMPNLGSTTLCQTDPLYNLTLLQDPQYPNGTWSGTGVNGTSFNPAGLSGNISVTFTATGNCVSPATTTITVNVPTTPAITGVPASICENAPAINLPTTQGGFTGNWSGQGVSNNSFNPSGLSGNITLTFTPNAGLCANPATTSISVNTPVTPAITGVPASICENENAISLPTTQGGFNGNWSGQGVNNNSFNPAGLSGGITLTFTPNAGQCANPATTSISVNTPVAPAIMGVPASICENENAISLPTTQGGFTGNWSGQGVSNNSFNPSGLSGNITLTFTPNAGQCANPATTSISVNTPVTPAITGVPASICETAAAIALPTTQGGFGGNWSGQGVSNNNFNPSGLSGNITLIFTPTAGQCTNPATTSISVNTPVTPAITGVPASICETENAISLPTTQGGFTGNWTGQGVSNNNFNPMGLNGGITLTFTPTAGQCASPATTTIVVNAPATPVLGTAMLCQNNGLYPLANLADPNFPAGTWSGPGVSGGNFNPAGQNGNVTLTFTPSANCTQPGTTTVTVFSTISFTNLDVVCDLATQTYTVSFTITGGTQPYTVNGVGLAGANFTSAPIASGTGYSFVLNDANNCGPVTVSGTQNCNCTTDAGTMNFMNAPLTQCYLSFQFSVPYNQNSVLDANDTIQFVLHDNPGATLGNILATAHTPVIQTPAGLTLGQTYYVSAVAGNDNGSGWVDLNDPCLSISQGVPIIFYIPTIGLGNDTTICAEDCYQMPLTFTGFGPYAVEYSVFVNGIYVDVFNETNLDNGTSIEFCPSDFNLTNGTVTIQVDGLIDNKGCIVFYPTNAPQPTLTLSIASGVTVDLSPTLCAGESILVNGTSYNEANPSGTEVFVGGTSAGCDSTVNVNLAFYPPAINNITGDICPGESVNVNGTNYDASNPTDTLILSNAAANGCDSVIYVNLTPIPSSTNIITQTLCTGGSLTVNGTVYDENNPSGTETIPGGAANGCDSIIVVNLSFNSVVTSNINPTLCPGGSVTVNGTVYNAANPSGTETMPGASYLGCDSVAMVSLAFFPPATGSFNETICQNSSVTVGGTVFNQNNPSGTVTIPGGSVNGCDSTVMVSLAFFPPATGSLNPTICQNGSVTVGGTVFNQNNPSGTATIPGGSVNGCDSTVMVSLAFFPPATGSFNETICQNGSVTVGGTVFNQNNPSGTATIPGGSVNGCDSTVNVSLAFYPDAVGNITEILQMGGSIVVNGTVYNEQNPSGTEIFVGGSYTGCDSTVVINLGFEGEDVLGIVEVTSPLCHFGDDGVITLTTIQGGVPPFVVALNGGSSSPVVNFPVVFDNLTFGFHTLTIIDALGTITTQEIFMADAPIFELDMDGPFSVPLGNSVTLGASSASQIVTWNWSPPGYLSCTDCPSPVSMPLNDIVYTLAVTDANGCTAEGKLTVLVEKLEQVYVPNAFSPNNDGINDELTIFAGPQVDKIKSFQIFDRWGELVHELYNFEPNDLQLGWNGTFNGEELDPGVFVWFAEILFLDGQVRLFKGGVSLIK